MTTPPAGAKGDAMRTKMPTIQPDTRYRGYWIVKSFAGELYFVQKDGFTIATCTSEADAKAAIDAVVG